VLSRLDDELGASTGEPLFGELDDEPLEAFMRTLVDQYVDASASDVEPVSELVREMAPTQRRRMVKLAATGSVALRLGLIAMWSRVDDALKCELAEIMLEELDGAGLADFFRTVVDEGATSELVTMLCGLRQGA
jgi:hypothetical protein